MNPTLQTYVIVAEEYARRRRKSNFWLKEHRIFQKFIRGRRILDVGCGTGQEAMLFLKDRFDYLGIDASHRMLKVAKKLAPQAKFKLMDMLKLKLRHHSFDGFWACASLLHIPRKRVGRVLKSLREILKPDGVGFISLKYKARPWEGMVEDAYPGHKRFFSYHNPQGFKKILAASGFRTVKFTSKINYRDPEKERWLCFFVKKGE